VIASLAVNRFRGFEALELPMLARVNLIGGINNAGKTALLEAIYLATERSSERLNQLPRLFRVPSGVNDDRYFWQWLAFERKSQQETTVSVNIPQIGNVQVVWYAAPARIQRPGNIILRHSGRELLVPTFPPELMRSWPRPEVFSPAPTTPIEDAQVYIRAAKKTDGEERIESLLREIEPRLKRVRAFPDEQSNQPLIHVSLDKGEALPANQLGQGFNRLLRIYSSVLCADAKIFLVDEVETGLHHSVLPMFWKGLAALARQEDIQIFATTHSREAIFDAHRVFSAEAPYDFAYHRLERVEGRIQVLTYDQARLEGADDRNFEVR
jgi:AAA15 family ATPase/GTPase